MIVHDTASFLENINTKFELLDGGKMGHNSSIDRLSDIFNDKFSSTVISNNQSLIQKTKDSNMQVKDEEMLVQSKACIAIDQRKETNEKIHELADASTQTTISVAKNSSIFDSMFKAKVF